MPGFLAEVLTWPKNYTIAVAVETAMGLGKPPTMFIHKDKQDGEWSDSDKKLAMAWTILQRETCRECGQPLWICRSSNKNLYFSTRTDTCYAKAEIDKWHDKKSNKKLKNGEYLYVVPQMRGDEPLPSRRTYLKEIAED